MWNFIDGCIDRDCPFIDQTHSKTKTWTIIPWSYFPSLWRQYSHSGNKNNIIFCLCCTHATKRGPKVDCSTSWMSEPECGGDHLIGLSKPGLLGGAEAVLGSIHQHQTLLNTGAYTGQWGPAWGLMAGESLYCSWKEKGYYLCAFSFGAQRKHTGNI